ncbi:MAG: amino acid synthesis family protein [Rhodobacteraceae bacterium]|nr:amino acid synthesis family protein [Paracoccaceae bacterium]
MNEFKLRKMSVITEEIHHEGGDTSAPVQRGAVMAIVRNPFAGKYVANLQPAMDDLKPLGLEMTDRLIDALGGVVGIDGYGKGAITGANGEIEHSALWHVPGGYSMRERLGEAKAIVPSAMKVGGMGCRIDIPLGHINAAYVRSHFDAIEVGFPDGPRADEIVFILAMAKGGRVHARMGGLLVEEVAGLDGLR